LRRNPQQAQEAAAHGLFRAQPAPRDPFDRQAEIREQMPRRLYPQPLDGTSRCLAGRLPTVVAATPRIKKALLTLSMPNGRTAFREGELIPLVVCCVGSREACL
jgi:hypothetical protein